jgi:hypothetical protein
LRRGVARDKTRSNKKRNSAKAAPDSRGQTTRRVTHGSMLKEPLPWGVNALSCDCQVFVILASSLTLAMAAGYFPGLERRFLLRTNTGDNKSLTIC